MAIVVPVAPSVDVITAQFAPQITGLYAGEAIEPCAPCYIKEEDGKVYMWDDAYVGAVFAGICPRLAAAEQPVTLLGLGTRFGYGSGLLPGRVLYLVGSEGDHGKYDDAPTAGDPNGVLMCIDTTDVVIIHTGVISLVAASVVV